ncbi:MAG: biotin--[acetyl-CoA-carboxylase] ligase [Opitutales bacterium]
MPAATATIFEKMNGGDERDQTILDALLAAPAAAFASGSVLARELGISRPALAARISRLQERGVPIARMRGHGYRIEWPAVSGFHGELIAALLRADGAVCSWRFREEVDSTNSEAERLLAAGEPPPLAVTARRQTAGRGRLGRRWESHRAENLYLTLAWRPWLPPARLQTFTLWMGLKACRHLRKQFGIPVMVKWPNDLQIEGRKLAGMLTEARIDADRTRDLIFGLGLNLAGDFTDFPPEVRARATNLSEHLEAPLDLNRAASGMITALLDAAAHFFAEPTSATLTAHWPEVDALEGREVVAHSGSEVLRGRAAGIDEMGCLRLVLSGSEGERRLHAGEVTLAPAHPA